MNHETPQSLFETVGQYLLPDGFGVDVDQEYSGYFRNFEGEHLTALLCVGIEEGDDPGVVVSAIPQIEVPPQSRCNIAELFTRINNVWGSGRFSLNMDNGNIRFVLGLHLMDGMLTQLMLERMIDVAWDAAETFTPLTLEVLNGRSPSISEDQIKRVWMEDSESSKPYLVSSNDAPDTPKDSSKKAVLSAVLA